MGDAPVQRTLRPSLWIVLCAILCAIVGVRLSGPSDLLDNDQLKPAVYATDAVANGRWIVQRDTSAEIASKPPLCTWISACAAELTGGRVTRLALAIPSIIGLAGMAALTMWYGVRFFGGAAGWWGALALLLCPMGFKQAILARTDSLYGFAGALVGLALWEGIRRAGRAWLWFWMACTFAMLTKGPVAIVLALGGLIAWIGTREGTSEAPPRRGALGWHALGILILAVSVGGWVWLAWREAGSAFLDKVLGRELIGHVVHSDSGTPPLVEFYLPVLYYLGRYAPASVVTALGLVGVMRHPSTDRPTRRFERFVFWWFVWGVVLFSVFPHQRPDLMTPIWVAGSLIAGRELARWTGPLALRARAALAGLWIAAGVIGGVLEHHVHAREKPEARGEVAIRALADDLMRRFHGAAPALVHVSDNSSLQFFLGRRVDRASREDALAGLAGDAPYAAAFAGSDDPRALGAQAGIGVHELARSGGPGQFEIVIVGNAAAAAMPEWSSAPPH